MKEKRTGKRKNGKRTGLGLGGGGAKGSVHLGVLRAFEEEGIVFDVVAGTSIGSFVGALYARGYSSREIEAAMIGSGLGDVKNLLAMRLAGVGVDGLVARATGNLEFDDLKRPFAAIATDLESGEEVVFTEGDLAASVGASCAIPPYFKAVERAGRRYVDGAFVNIVPCDAAKALGADFVVGVDLSMGRQTTERNKKTLDEAYPKNGVKRCNPTEKGYAACDYMLAPDLAGFTSASFGGVAEMFDIGYFLTKEKMPEIKAAMRKAKVLP